MNSTKDSVNLIFSGILACCALVITGLVVTETISRKWKVPNSPRILENWNRITVSTTPLGNPDAPVRILEFFDYQCPYCKQVQPTLRQLLRSYKDKVYFQPVHFPLNIHPEAYQAAIAAECAAKQDRFQEYHELIFRYQEELDSHPWIDIAAESQIPDLWKFNQCLHQETTKSLVEEGTALADELDISSIPTFLINGRLVSGAISGERFALIIEQVLEKAGEK